VLTENTVDAASQPSRESPPLLVGAAQSSSKNAREVAKTRIGSPRTTPCVTETAPGPMAAPLVCGQTNVFGFSRDWVEMNGLEIQSFEMQTTNFQKLKEKKKITYLP
jgi:hypothetical protein